MVIFVWISFVIYVGFYSIWYYKLQDRDGISYFVRTILFSGLMSIISFIVIMIGGKLSIMGMIIYTIIIGLIGDNAGYPIFVKDYTFESRIVDRFLPGIIVNAMFFTIIYFMFLR